MYTKNRVHETKKKMNRVIFNDITCACGVVRVCVHRYGSNRFLFIFFFISNP